MLGKKLGDIITWAEELDLVTQLKLIYESARLVFVASASASGQAHLDRSPPITKQRRRTNQGGMVFLSGKPRGHQNGRFAFVKGNLGRPGEFPRRRAIVDHVKLVTRMSQAYQVFSYAMTDRDNGIGMPGQSHGSQSLHPNITLDILFDHDHDRNFLPQGCHPTPDVIAVPMGNKDIRMKITNLSSELGDGHDLGSRSHLGPPDTACFEIINERLIQWIPLAPENDHRVEIAQAFVLDGGINQKTGHTGPATGAEYQDPSRIHA
jgi:hypothetical protein